MPNEPRSILITGASSGIGAALATLYAVPGVTLALGGRDGPRLAAVAAACRARGASAEWTAFDVTDGEAAAAWVARAEAIAPLDLVIANAGIGSSAERTPAQNARAERTPAQGTRVVFAVNLDGVLNTVLPAADLMRAREADPDGRRGQIAIMSSLASFRGFAHAPAYCASKAALRIYGEGLRTQLGKEGIGVSVVCPGYIRTPMTTGNPFPMPFLMSAERAARIIREGLARGRGRIAFPWPMYMAVWLLAALPDRIVDPLMRRIGY